MGKRKSSKPPPTKQKPKLDATFNCPFCNSGKSVAAVLDRESKQGQISCTVCGANYRTPINALSEAIDVYSDWIDACDAEND